jgi:hypothetical protein
LGERESKNGHLFCCFKWVEEDGGLGSWKGEFIVATRLFQWIPFFSCRQTGRFMGEDVLALAVKQSEWKSGRQV